jgi:hypothetical protein
MFQIAKMNLQLKVANPLEGNYRAYYSLVNSGKEQPNYPWRPL